MDQKDDDMEVLLQHICEILGNDDSAEEFLSNMSAEELQELLTEVGRGLKDPRPHRTKQGKHAKSVKPVQEAASTDAEPHLAPGKQSGNGPNTRELACQRTQSAHATVRRRGAPTNEIIKPQPLICKTHEVSDASVKERKSRREERQPQASPATATVPAKASADAQSPDVELFLNVCMRCGETRLLAKDHGPDFICETAGESCVADGVFSPREAARKELAGAAEDGSPPEEDADEKRLELLWQVLTTDMTAYDAAALLTAHGLDPPHEGELEQLRNAAHAGFEEEAKARRAFMREARKEHIIAKKKPQRYLNNELVQVAKEGRTRKYLVTGGETAEQKQRTGVSIRLMGRHQHSDKVKTKGPRS